MVSSIAFEFEIIQLALLTLAKSPSGTIVGGSLLFPSLNQAADQSTNFVRFFALIEEIEVNTCFGQMSPLYIIQQAMYLFNRGSHVAMVLAGSNKELVI